MNNTADLIQKITDNDYQAIYNAGQYGTGNDSVPKERFEQVVVPFVDYVNQHHLIVGPTNHQIEVLEVAQNKQRTSIYFTCANNLMGQLDVTANEFVLHLDVMGTPLTFDLVTNSFQTVCNKYFRQLQIFNYQMMEYL